MAISPLNNANNLVCLIRWTVHCAEGIINLNVIQREALTQECGCAMIQAVSCRPLTEKAHVRLQASQREICVGKNGICTGVSSMTLVSTYPYVPSMLDIHLCL